MSSFDIMIGGVQNEASDTKSQSSRIKHISSEVSSCADSLKLSLDNAAVIAAIRRISDNILEEAAREETFSEALKTIAGFYTSTDKNVANGSGSENIQIKNTESGTDKRSGWRKFWDWILDRDVDTTYAATTDAQERAADLAFQKRIQELLKEERFSEKHWSHASVEERKQILQEYMREVAAILGVEVDDTIVWTNTPPTSDGQINIGAYNHASRSVRINEYNFTRKGYNSYALMTTIVHELRHAYQYSAIDHPDRYRVSQETIDSWKQSFDTYQEEQAKGYEYYRRIVVEVDARRFAGQD